MCHGVQILSCGTWDLVLRSGIEPGSPELGGFRGGASGKEPACQCRRHRRRRFDPWVGKVPRSRKWQPTSVFLSGKSHGQRDLAGYSPSGRKELETT